MAIIQKSFSDLVDFARASAATYIDAMGVIRTAATDEPRFTHDPVTGESLGLLAERQATNLIPRSNGSFGRSSGTQLLTGNDTTFTAPDGTRTATKIWGSTTNGAYAQPLGGEWSHTILIGDLVTYSVFCKPVSQESGEIEASILNARMATPRDVGCVLSPDGSFRGENNPERFGVEALPDGWYRMWVSIDATGVSTTPPRVRLPDTEVAEENGWYFWGMQFEEGLRATSYIPTEGSQVTRAGDHNMVSIPSQNSNREGSLYIDLTSFVFGIHSAALVANNPFEGYLLLWGRHISPEGMENGITLGTFTGQVFFPLPGSEENKRYKLSVGWSGRSLVAFLDGVKVVDEIDAGHDIPSFNELNLFSDSDVGLASMAAGVVK